MLLFLAQILPHPHVLHQHYYRLRLNHRPLECCHFDYCRYYHRVRLELVVGPLLLDYPYIYYIDIIIEIVVLIQYNIV